MNLRNKGLRSPIFASRRWTSALSSLQWRCRRRCRLQWLCITLISFSASDTTSY